MRTRAIIALLILAVAGSTVGIARMTRAQQQPPPGPAPTEDRVGFPENYRTEFQEYYVFDRPDNKQVRVIYANDRAAAWRDGEPFLYGSILVMETYRAELEADGSPKLDENGRFMRGELTGIFVMRKEPGFGEAYEQNRTGEWEYVAFRPDKSYSTPPQNSASCAICHGDAGTEKDWTFRTNLHTQKGSGAVPVGVIQAYSFLPSTITVKAGATVTWYNDDGPAHTITADNGSFDSGRVLHGNSFSQTFAEPGTYDFHCNVHPAFMKGRVIVQ